MIIMKTNRYTLFFAFLFALFSSQAEDYYWVGGSGLWSDLNSWRTPSGQIPNEVPDGSDNVFFNENSFIAPFDTVFILTGNPTCNNMTWSNIIDTVVIVGGSNTTNFNIFGSVTMHPKVQNWYYGKISFLSENPGNTITCAKTVFKGDLRFEGAGEWILQDTLFVHDSTDWKYIIEDNQEPLDPNPIILHTNGRLDANEQTIICRGFATTGNNPREFDFANAHALLLGNWTLNAENLNFNGSNSYILFGGEMSNLKGDEIHYYDIDVMPLDGAIKNTDIRTFHRKIHFLGSGSIDGKKTPGVEGSFTIDTLIFEGAITMMGPIPCEVKGPYHDIHYTLINVVDGHFDVKEGYFHRIDFWGSDFGRQLPSDFRGLNSVADSIHFFRPMGQVFGYNTINNLLFFKTIGSISAEVLQENTVNHAVFSGDGIFEGTNNFDLLTLNTGFRYQIACDSLFLPGSTYTYTNVQNINGLEVVGDCDNGLCYLSSKMKPAVAIINYTGGALATEYLFVRDILNMGDPINITNGVDGGNNQNINFTNPLQGRTLYWVNGQGEWSRRNHWSLSSGGVGDQCPPTILDDVFFDNGSGFNADTDTSVFVNLPHLYCNDMTWVDGLSSHVYFQSYDTAIDITFNTDSMAIQYDTVISYYDTTSLYIAGSIELDTAMSFLFLGDVHFISDNDDDYEILDLKYTYGGEVYWDFFKKTYFNGEGGKWRLRENTKFYNNYDTVYFQMGEILIDDDSVSFRSFISLDTLPRRLSLLNKTLVEVRIYQGDGWSINASYSLTGDTLFFLDAGRSTIRSLGDISPPPLQPPGFCHIRTYGGELEYWNIEFGWEEAQAGLRSMLKSESKCTYNLVDYYYSYCDGVGTGIIDTLTWKPSSTGSRLRNNFWINYVMAYGFGDTLMQSHIIDTAIFFNEGGLYGGHFIGYLEARKFLGIQFVNQIDTAVLKGNAEILGKNTFSQLVLAPNKRYIFQNEDGSGYDTTFINDDFIVDGFCDEPIRMQSDSIGTRAKILYKRQNPTYTDFTANNVSMRDISMLPHNGIEYIATNSVDLGNNENWTFVESNNSVYYWIGGQGKWGDWQHWSYTSGGPPIEDKCTPKEINTVVFDDNSFERANDTVYIDVRNAYCNNMYWVHSEADFKPTFLGADTTVLFVYGSMMLNDSMNYEYYGEVFFDQFNDPGGQPDTIYSKGHTFWNDIYLQGIDDVVVMDDDLTLYVDPGTQVFRIVHHNHGEFRLNGNHMRTGGYYSLFKSPRALNMTNSQATVLYDFERAWWVEGENFELFADNSTIFNESFMGTVVTENGDYFKYNDVIFKGPVDSLYNKNNMVEYNIVDIQMESGLVAGNFIADSVLMNGSNSGMFQTSTTNVVMINAMNGSINNNHTVGRAVVNKFGFIRGANTFDHCVFFDDGVFMGKNVFDTLVLYPGVGDFQNQGNWFYFEADTAQVVVDSLYLRGNQCSNINITSLSQPKLAYIRKNNGAADVSCDFLNIYSVAAESENLDFYAGTNSTPLPNPNNPPPGWIFDNAQGYIPGFNGRTERFCQGEPYVIDAASFNGDPSTQYFWEGSQYPGNPDYTITEPGTYHIRVQYFDGCYVDDYIVLEGDFPPEASIPEGPYCEGEPIEVTVSPDNTNYQYKWWNGETTPTIEAKVQYSGGIYVAVTDPTNNCKATPNQTIVVKPTPDPEDALGNDITIKYGESITLDAGFGDYYEWTSTPEVPIDNPNQREITVPGYIEPIEYKAYVEIDGCPAEGFKVVTMYPPSKLGIPTAFSPNGDGVNDELKILGSGFDKIDFKVFNRYGELVFETNDAEISWDGTYKGKKQEMDVYTYYIKVVYLDKGVVEESGNISLLR
jgi:gliding motility-associated-like protein